MPLKPWVRLSYATESHHPEHDEQTIIDLPIARLMRGGEADRTDQSTWLEATVKVIASVELAAPGVSSDGLVDKMWVVHSVNVISITLEECCV